MSASFRTDMGAPPKPTRWRGEVPWPYSPAEIRADGVIHALGLALAMLGVIALFIAMPKTSPANAGAIALYLATLIFSLAASAAYNMWPISPRKWLLRRFDHSAIYLLIAGTYTPFMVRVETWWLLALVWSVAVLGVTLKIALPGRFDRLALVLYLALGWSGVAIHDRLITSLHPAVLWLIGIGGLVYTSGVIFHLWERLKFQNAIWHGFVLTAATIHFAAVWANIALPA